MGLRTPKASTTFGGRPVGFLTGKTGVGKTTAALLAFSDYAYVPTRPGAHRAVETWAEMYPEDAERYRIQPPKFVREAIDEHEQVGTKLVPVTDWLDEWRGFLAKWKTQGHKKFPGIVIDEFTTLLAWAYRDAGKPRHTEGGKWAANTIRDLAHETLQTFRDCGSGAIFIGHWKDAVFWTAGEKIGDLKYPAGPNMPIGGLIGEFVQQTDFCWLLADKFDDGLDADTEAETGKVIYTQPRTAVETIKTAGFGLPRVLPVETPFTFRDALAKLRFDVGRND